MMVRALSLIVASAWMLRGVVGEDILEIEFTIHAKSNASQYSWDLVSADGDVPCSGSEGEYEDYQDYERPCYVTALTTYTLTCYDSYGDGWAPGYISVKISGCASTEYCTDFGRTEQLLAADDAAGDKDENTIVFDSSDPVCTSGAANLLPATIMGSALWAIATLIAGALLF